jgi:NADH-quinone oxidoreductase subunit N
MAVFLLSLLGFPVFGGMGFFAKWYLVQATLASPVGLAPLAVILVITSVISAGYYLQVVRVMFMKERPAGILEPPATGALTRAVLGVSVAAILAFGLFPSSLIRLSSAAGFRPYPSSPAMGVNVPAHLR